MSEIYVSTDVETDGPIPGPHSMLSLASAAFMHDGTRLGTFAANLETLPGAEDSVLTSAFASAVVPPTKFETASAAPPTRSRTPAAMSAGISRTGSGKIVRAACSAACA